MERPTTLMITQAANLNRDAKKRRTPYSMEDFYLYQPLEELNLPAERYGAAALWMVNEGIFPAFALFCFSELRKNAGKVLPTVICYSHPSAVLLAPTRTREGVKGLLICENLVSNQQIEMESPCGQTIRVRIPTVQDEVAAEEDVMLQFC